MNLQKVWALGSSSQLSHCLNKGHALDISDCSAQFDYAYIRLFVCVVDRNLSHPLDPMDDGVCDMRHDLDSLAEVVALPLTFDDMLVDFSGGDIVLASQSDV